MDGIALFVLGEVLRALQAASIPETRNSDEDDQPTFEGEVSAGLRLLDVEGSEEQFEEDSNLDEGLFLRNLVLRAEGLDTATWPIESLEVRASGIGDPRSAYRFEAESGPWKTVGSFDRTQFAGNAQADLHPFDVEREIGSLGLEYDASENGGSRSSLEIDYLRRDGIELGSRNFGFEYVSGFPLRREDLAHGARGKLFTNVGDYGLELMLGFEDRRASERNDFVLPSQIFPAEDLSEEFDAKSESRAGLGAVRLDREFAEGKGRLDGGLEWEETDVLGDFTTNETGFLFDPTLPFERDTQGDLDLEQRRLGGDAGISYRFENDLELSLRFTRETDEKRGELLRTVLLDEFTGDPPSVFQFLDTSTHDDRLDLVEVGLSTPIGQAANLDVRGEWGREEIDVEEIVELVPVRIFDDTLEEFGGEGTLALDLGRGVHCDLSGGHFQRPTESADVGVGFTFEDERTSYGALGCRWNTGPRATLSTNARYEHRDSDAFRSEADLGRYALSIAGHPNDRLWLDATASYQSFELEAETNFLILDPNLGILVVPGIASFDSHQRTIVASTQFDALPFLRPRLGFSLSSSAGDSSFEYLTVHATLPYVHEAGFELGVESSLFRFEGDGLLDDSDYRAFVLEIYARKSFGGALPIF